jgi:leucyl-tRNA synthetase
MLAWLKKERLGKKVVNYKMRDWVFSRQRYWGEPIPLIHCDKCGVVPVPEKDLPVKLPKVKAYQPAGTGESPLATIEKWVNVKCPKCGGKAKRETNTMPQWAGSSWYYLRYIDPKNKKALVDKKKEKKMMPVDVYVGGDHATRHLIYARFWHKFLYDQGVVSTPEPFKRLEFLGLILASDGRKMSKRWGNVINPNDMVREFGADAFRLYEMFMGPFEQSIAWNTQGVTGTRRFLEKVWRLALRVESDKRQATSDKALESLLHQTIKKVTEDIETFKFNTAISALMILVNEMEKASLLQTTSYKLLLLLLSPFAPHITEELWSHFGEKKSIFLATWPKYDAKKIVAETVKIAVQVNGKVRTTLLLDPKASEEAARALALADEKVKMHLADKTIRKVIYIPGKIVSIVVG